MWNNQILVETSIKAQLIYALLFFAVKTSIFPEQKPHICVLGLSNLVKGSTEYLAGTEGNYSITIFIYKKATA